MEKDIVCVTFIRLEIVYMCAQVPVPHFIIGSGKKSTIKGLVQEKEMNTNTVCQVTSHTGVVVHLLAMHSV
jgi:hypothetical protein